MFILASYAADSYLPDIILKVAGILTVKGGTGAIIEYMYVYPLCILEFLLINCYVSIY